MYSPIHFDPHDKRIPKILIGYIRLRVQTSSDQGLAWKTILQSAAASFLLTLASVLVINFIVRKYVLRPVLKLHRAISGHVEGEFTDTVPVESADEIGELSAEFNRMRTAVGQWKERLADEKERLAVTLRSIGDGVIVTDASGIVVSLNTAAEHHTGWTTFEASGKHLTEVFKIINQNTRLSCENPVEQALRVNDVVGLANHTVLIRKDGSEVMIEDSAAPITDNKGATIGVVLVFRDVTSRIKAREELEKSEEKYRRIVDTAAEGIVSLDAKQAITFVNAKMSQLIGYQPDELIGKTFVSLMDPGEIDDQKKRVENRMKGYSETYERLFLKKNGAQVWTIVSATPMTDAEKKVTGSFAMVTDITARKKAEKTLETLNVELENRVRERTAEIEEKNRELKRLNKLFVNRELRMIELKERIRRLEGVPQDETPGP